MNVWPCGYAGIPVKAVNDYLRRLVQHGFRVALCEQLQAAGFRAVPHLSARMVRDRAHLVDLIAWLEGAGVDRAFVVGGDAKEPGAYVDGLSLLREMAEIGHPYAMDQEHFTLFLVQHPRGWDLQTAWPKMKKFE